MPDIVSLIQQGSSNLFVFIPVAILLGALHGLEPGHSKTMMAAFIVAIRGTVKQAALLGLAATISHTAVVWIVALGGLYFMGGKFDAENTEPYFQIISGILMVAIAAWMMRRNWKHHRAFQQEHSHHHDETHIINTEHGLVKLQIYEKNQSPRFRIIFDSERNLFRYRAKDIELRTERADGSTEVFTFIKKDGFFESEQDIAEPHEFTARLRLFHHEHSHNYDVEFVEHGHHHVDPALKTLDVVSPEYQDAHELAHANDIRNRFTDKNVTTPQIIMFGLTGGLIPCPASITVLLLCLQLKKITLGTLLVFCFSIGLALVMVASGTVAALSVKHVSKRWSGFSKLARTAPYLSGSLIAMIGLYVAYHGLIAILGV